MKPASYHLPIVLLLAGLFGIVPAIQASDAMPIIAKTPYVVVVPNKPVANGDSVVLQVMIGTASNACMAPTFSKCTFTIEESPLAIYPPQFSVTISYVETPVTGACPMNYDPVDYGPRYMLGKLPIGTYRVVSVDPSTGSGTKLYGQFSVAESAIPIATTIKGSVHDDPFPLERMSRPVAGAKIYLRNSGLSVISTSADRIIADRILDSATTDSTGSYRITNVAAGTYNLTCTHQDYRSVTVAATIAIGKDVVVNFTVVPVSAAATVTGIVTLTGPLATRVVPMAGCTVSVSTADPSTVALPEASVVAPVLRLQAVTDNNGRYTIAAIPLSANGQVWYVRAAKGAYSEVKRIALANMRTDSVNFSFSGAYENSDSVVVNYAVFKIAADKFTYQEKDAVKIRYSITNNSKSDMTFGPFSSGCEYDLQVTTAGSALATAVYRESDQSGCLAMVSQITVAPGKTVVHDFPPLYMSDLKWSASGAMVAPRSIKLLIAARLRGTAYDYTVVDVEATMELGPAVKAVTSAKHGTAADATFDTRTGKLSLTIDKEQNVSVACYTLGGALIGKTATSQRFPAGMHTLAVRNVPASSNMYIVNVQGKSFSRRFTSVGVGR